MNTVLALYLLLGLVAAAFTIAADLRDNHIRLEDMDEAGLMITFLLRATTWPYGLFIYRKKK